MTKKSRRLAEGQRTIIIGVRVPSRMDWEVGKVVRELISEGYDTTKSEIVRYCIEDSLAAVKDLYKTKNEPVKYEFDEEENESSNRI